MKKKKEKRTERRIVEEVKCLGEVNLHKDKDRSVDIVIQLIKYD